MEQNLNLYQIFYEVAGCCNFSAAAKKLYISQPAVSKAVSKLEQSLNVTLFHRSSRGVTLTHEGEILYIHVRQALTSLKSGEELLRKAASSHIIYLSIGVSTTLCKYVLLPLLKTFIMENPNIKINISCQSTFDTIAAIENGTIDLGLIGLPSEKTFRQSGSEITYLPLTSIEDIFVSTDTYLHSLQTKYKADSQAQEDFFHEAAFIMLDKGNISRKHADGFLDAHRITLHNVMEVNNMDLAIEFARAGLGIACVISDFVKTDLQSGALKEIKLGHRIPRRQIGFVYPTRSSSGDAIDRLVKCYSKLNPC